MEFCSVSRTFVRYDPALGNQFCLDFGTVIRRISGPSRDILQSGMLWRGVVRPVPAVLPCFCVLGSPAVSSEVGVYVCWHAPALDEAILGARLVHCLMNHCLGAISSVGRIMHQSPLRAPGVSVPYSRPSLKRNCRKLAAPHNCVRILWTPADSEGFPKRKGNQSIWSCDCKTRVLCLVQDLRGTNLRRRQLSCTC